MGFLMWLLVLLRMFPLLLGVGLALLVLSMISPLPRYLALLALAWAVCWGAGVFAREFFGRGGPRQGNG